MSSKLQPNTPGDAFSSPINALDWLSFLLLGDHQEEFTSSIPFELVRLAAVKPEALCTSDWTIIYQNSGIFTASCVSWILVQIISTYGTAIKVKSRPPLLAAAAKARVNPIRVNKRLRQSKPRYAWAIKRPFPCETVDDFNLYPPYPFLLLQHANQASICLFNIPQKY